MKGQRVQTGVIIVMAIVSAVATVTILLAIARDRLGGRGPHAGPGPMLVGPGGRSSGGMDAGIDEPLPVLFNAPDFRLTEASERPLRLADLRGQVWVANFMFTTCGSICPLMTQAMEQLQEKLQKTPQQWEGVRLVSFSVDPDRDTPAVLRAYAKENQADTSHWYFLTGNRNVIWMLVKDGFKLPVEPSAGDAQSPILHSGKFVLVDRQGQVRGLYEGQDEEDRTRLLADIKRLLAEPAPAPATPTTEPATTAPAESQPAAAAR